jgi:hypothetical protein
MESSLLTSPTLIDLILLFTVLEALVLSLVRRRTGHGLHPRAVVLLLLPGIFLMLALRAALAGGAWPWVPAALFAALVAHLMDLRQRWRG